MPPPVYIAFLLIFVLPIVFGMIALFASLTTRKDGERNRRAGLGLASAIGGLPIGLGFAFLLDQMGEISPADRTYMFVKCGVMGVIAGFIASVFFALTALLVGNAATTQDPRSPVSTSPTVDSAGVDHNPLEREDRQ